MKRKKLLDHIVVRNLLGLLALLVVHYLTDLYAIDQRPGFSKLSPYLYLLLLYGWLVFHNRMLFERFFLLGRKGAYLGWMFLLMALGSFNMNFILHTEFGIQRTLPFIVNFWVYTVTGLGVYMTYRYLYANRQENRIPLTETEPHSENAGYFGCMVDGVRQPIAYDSILYIESLENYVKVITKPKTYVTRLTLKEAEKRLPKRQFVRISRSYIVNTAHVDRSEADMVWVGTKELRIGKVYKRYVAEQFTTE
ncbi:LytTR family DNA-binding domain-containing protein [Spirosoma sp. SC4-14]|uniref:LytR/AlgR family response regulator transcription factor n=1 Tax=Spirosoma sp. SC4-14 TaxID=3128900 RepID=UPI0030D23A28